MKLPFRSMRGTLARVLAGLVALTSAVAIPAHADEQRAAVWSLRGAHNTVYLAGSVHALPKDKSALPQALERAYQESEALVMEVDLDDLNPIEAVQFLAAKGTLTDGRKLADVLGAASYAEVQKLAASLGVPEVAIMSLEPWAASMVLTQFALMRTGYDPQLGIDMQLVARAKADAKPIDGLETIEEQLGIFDARSLEEQIRFLDESVRDVPQMDTDLARLVDGWRRGDMRALEKEFESERATAPELYDELLGARNRRWIPKIEALLKSDKDYLVVVGTLHFVGKDGLLALLAKDGHKAKPVPEIAPAKKD
jgi:uncharacterized protein YbaP (TraB family)